MKNKFWTKNKRQIISTFIITMMIISGLIMSDFNISEASSESTFELEQRKTEENQKRLLANEKLPVITKSLERDNLKRRLEFMNQSDRISYIYMFSAQGQLIREEQVLGKISSVNSLLTTPDQVIKLKGDFGYYASENTHVVASPDFDGSYGENGDAIFWFTPDGEYKEWNGIYKFSSTRKTFTIQPILIDIVGQEDTK